MRFALTLLVLLLELRQLVAVGKCECLPRPIVAPIQDVSLPNGASTRGIPLTLGSNNQRVSFLASSNSSETYVYGKDGRCAKDHSLEKCMMFRGGVYDGTESSTDKPIDDRKESDGFNAAWVEDSLSFDNNVSLSSFGFGVPQQNFYTGTSPTQAELGLGEDSSLLRALESAGHIGTRVYSIFWGLVGGPTEKQTRGSIILGGLDKSLIMNRNDNFTASLSYRSGCGTGLLVIINDMLLSWPNGTDTSISTGLPPILACIDLSWTGLMNMPRENYRRLLSLTSSDGPELRTAGINFWTMLFSPENVYQGGLTIKLQNGQNNFSINVPNTELVVPDRYVDSDGMIKTNTSFRNLVINSLQHDNENDLPLLGRLFMTSAYVMVTYEAETFTIWQVNSGSRPSDVVAVDANNNLISEFCTNSTSSPISPVPRNEGSKLPGDAIAGICAGAAAGTAKLSILGFFIYQRQSGKKHGERVELQAGKSQVVEMQAVNAKPPAYSSVQAEPQELMSASAM